MTLPCRNIGRPLLIGDFDSKVADYLHELRCTGGIVNHNIIIAAAEEIISHKNSGLLKDHGGHIHLGKLWAESFLTRHGYRKKGHKNSQKSVYRF